MRRPLKKEFPSDKPQPVSRCGSVLVGTVLMTCSIFISIFHPLPLPLVSHRSHKKLWSPRGPALALHPSNGLFSDFVDDPDDLVINLNVDLANLYFKFDGLNSCIVMFTIEFPKYFITDNA